jgi:hypothetical protein
MCQWFSRNLLNVESGRVQRTLLAAALMIPMCGCALGDAFSHDDPSETEDRYPPLTSGATYAWGGAPDGFGSPTWSETSSVFGAPAWGPAPSVYGSRLHVPPGESAAARVLALTEQLAASKSENEQLNERIRKLEADVESGTKALARASSEVIETRTELASARTDLEQWKREIATMREKLEAADKENLSTLQTTVGLLQQMLTQPESNGE